MEVTREVEVMRPAPSPVVERLEVPVTVLVDSVRTVEITKEVEVPVTVEVAGPVPSPVVEIQEVPVTVLVDAGRTIEVTREVEVPVTVEVTTVYPVVETVEVPVTRVVTASGVARPVELCNDYPYMVALLESQRDFFTVLGTFATSAELRDYYQVQTLAPINKVDANRRSICGDGSDYSGLNLHMMTTLEGLYVCNDAADSLEYQAPRNWQNVPLLKRQAFDALLTALLDYCYEGKTGVAEFLFRNFPIMLELLREL